MPRKSTPSPLAARLAELKISAEECAQIVKRPLEQVESWLDGEEPDGESHVLLRLFIDEDRARAATLAAERIRSKHIHGWQGEDWQTADVAPPYGAGYHGADAGSPQ